MQVASLKDTIARKDEEIDELQLLKDLRGGSSIGRNSLRHSSSFSGISASGGLRGQRLASSRVGRLAERTASDTENCSEISDKFSDNSSQQSVDDIKYQKENIGDTDLEERLSDISDGGHSMGAETDNPKVAEAGKLSKITKEKM